MQTEPHLMTEDAESTRSGSIFFLDTLGEDAPQEVLVLFHFFRSKGSKEGKELRRMLGDNFYHRLFFGDMCTFDSPFLRIKIVGAMADILLEA